VSKRGNLEIQTSASAPERAHTPRRVVPALPRVVLASMSPRRAPKAEAIIFSPRPSRLGTRSHSRPCSQTDPPLASPVRLGRCAPRHNSPPLTSRQSPHATSVEPAPIKRAAEPPRARTLLRRPPLPPPRRARPSARSHRQPSN
jgi:hypothetical protein